MPNDKVATCKSNHPHFQSVYIYICCRVGRQGKKQSGCLYITPKKCLTDILECQVKMAARFHSVTLRDIWLWPLTQAPSSIY